MAGENAECKNNCTALQGFNLNLLFFSAASFIALYVFLLFSSWPQSSSSSMYYRHVSGPLLPWHSVHVTISATFVFFFPPNSWETWLPANTGFNSTHIEYFAKTGAKSGVSLKHCAKYTSLHYVCRSRYNGKETSVIKEAGREVRTLLFLSLCLFLILESLKCVPYTPF